jgi:hypothetical protein
MGIASWKSRFLQIFNRDGNQRRQNNGPSEVKNFKVPKKKKQPSTPEIAGSNRYRWIVLSAVSVDIMTLTTASGLSKIFLPSGYNGSGKPCGTGDL